MSDSILMDLHHLFHPKNIAVVGQVRPYSRKPVDFFLNSSKFDFEKIRRVQTEINEKGD
ncbi:MAG: hypothetical protein ABSE95_13830 [Thermodesulfobacteriota bacterium]